MKNITNYYTIRAVQTGTCLEFDNLDAFYRFTKMHQLADIFLLLNAHNEAEYFGAVHNQILFRHATLGFKTLEDYCTAVKNNFPGAPAFYEAQEKGYDKYEDYQLVREAGISDKAIFEKIKAAGFISGFDDFAILLQAGEELPVLPPFANPYELYKYATANGFDSYANFRTAIVKGFTDDGTYRIATEHGFSSYADYKEAIDKGVRTFADLRFLRDKNIRDRDDCNRYLDLQALECDGCAHDQKVLLTLLSRIEQGKKISFNKLKDAFLKSVEEYRYAGTGEMPAWFTKALHTDEDLILFLQKNKQVKAFGDYDGDGEFFEINRMQDRSVVLDGSNVAHGNKGNADSKPSVANIMMMVQHLKAFGFTEILVIVDASLKHRLQDKEKIEELKEQAEYLEAPSENPADIFIINYVKRNHCLLVSNDTFREWKVQDPWIAENIDFYRLAFMIKGEQVIMPDLK